MARPDKRTVDYFPFYVKDGRTLFILESKYGCKGTGFFTNVLRFLCSTPDHHYRITNESDKLYFFSKVHCDVESGMDMLNMMAATGKIDAGYWVSGVIYSADLVESISDAYKKRQNKPLDAAKIEEHYSIKKQFPAEQTGLPLPETPVPGSDNPQRKEKKRKEKKTPQAPLTKIQQERFDAFYASYPKKKSRGQAEKTFSTLNPDEQLLRTMLDAIERAKTSDEWTKENGRFIPHPATWLNAKGWLDESTEVDPWSKMLSSNS